jgi:hypothetical protein
VALALLAAVACSTGSGGGSGDWSRDYVATEERVHEAVIAAIDEIDFYLVDEDMERGRIRARSSARRADLEATMIVDLRTLTDRVRVDVMIQSSDLEVGRAPVQVSGVVRDFFTHLDARLEGRVD